MSEKFEQDKRPFAEELLQSPFVMGAKLFELKEHPGIVVRLERVNVSTKEKLAEAVANLNKNKELFSSLEKAGMHVAKFDYTIGNKDQDGWAESYALVEKIDGKQRIYLLENNT